MSGEGDFDAAFAEMKRFPVGAGLATGAVFLRGLNKLVALTAVTRARDFSVSDFAAAGGLMSYGSDVLDSYRLAGLYRRVLKGENPPIAGRAGNKFARSSISASKRLASACSVDAGARTR
jgi:putative ABC transport system substrate-binding protein